MTITELTQPEGRVGSAKPDSLDLLEQFGTTIRFSREQEIRAAGEPAGHCYRVVSGCVRTVRLSEDGRRSIGDFHLPGDLVGLADPAVADSALEAVTDTVLRRYPRRMVESLADGHAALSRRLRAVAFAHLQVAAHRAVLLGHGSAPERIAAFLLEMARRLGHRGSGMLELPMGRADIADHLGLTVETICRVLAAMKRDGIVATSRTGVALRDRAALRAIAERIAPLAA